MSFSFKYKPVLLHGGLTTKRPLIPLRLIGEKEVLDIFGILDSGSDMTVIPKDMADFLGIKIVGKDELTGISNEKTQVEVGYIKILFGKDREEYESTIPVLINKQGDSIVIGRDGFFDQFKITFNEFEKRITFKKIIPKPNFK